MIDNEVIVKSNIGTLMTQQTKSSCKLNNKITAGLLVTKSPYNSQLWNVFSKLFSEEKRLQTQRSIVEVILLNFRSNLEHKDKLEII